MIVYTFWEPREKMPYYIQLCIETWKKNLPNAEIVLLDYKNLGEFLDVRELGLNLFSGNFKLALVADAIRIALLAKYGGVWLDADTIILTSGAEKYLQPDKNNKMIFFGNPKNKLIHLAFINTPSATKCMMLWCEVVKKRIELLGSTNKLSSAYLFANDFIDKYAREFPQELSILNRRLVMPEFRLLSTGTSHAHRLKAYSEYYFQ